MAETDDFFEGAERDPEGLPIVDIRPAPPGVDETGGAPDAPPGQPASLLEQELRRAVPPEQEVAGLGKTLVEGGVKVLRRAQEGADLITRQRALGDTPTSAAPSFSVDALIGDRTADLVSRIEATAPTQIFDPTGSAPLPDKAININLSRLDTTDDIKQAIVETSKLFEGEIQGARRGVQTNEQTEALADELGLTVKQLLKRQRGEAFNAETAVAARRILASSARQLVALAKAAAEDGGDRSLAAYQRALTLHGAIQQQVSGLTAEAGRALQSYKILAASDAELTRNIGEVLEAAGGSADIRKMARRIAAAADSGGLTKKQLDKFARGSMTARTGDALLELWINSLLSGPTTQMVNILSNTLVAFWQLPIRAMASVIPGGGTQGVARGEVISQAYGMVRGFQDGLVLAARSIRTGESTDTLAKIDLPQRRAISSEAFELSGNAARAVDFFGEYVARIPGRLLLAGDELFKAVGYRMELHARAYRVASSEGLDGDDMARRMTEIVENPPEDIRMAAIDASRYQTFTKPLGRGGQGVQQIAQALPIMRLVVPFIRTPANIMKFVGEGTVLAPLSRNVREEIIAGGARRQLALAKIAMGSMASTWAFTMAAEGRITGNGPSEPKSRSIWLNTHQANSIRIGEKWFSFSRLEPLGAFFGIAADFQQIMGELDEREAEEVASSLVAAFSRNVTSKTFLRGLTETARVFDDPDRYAARYVQRFAGTLLPTLSAQVTRAGIPFLVEADPVLRDVRSIYDQLCSRLPGCSDSLPPRRNIWGEVIVLGGGLGPDIMSPIYTSVVREDQNSDEILRVGVTVSMPSRQIGGVELSAEEYSEYVRISGEIARKNMARLIKRADYKRSSDGKDGMKAVKIRNLMTAAKKEAQGIMSRMPEFKELGRRIRDAGIAKRKKLNERAPAGPLTIQ